MPKAATHRSGWTLEQVDGWSLAAVATSSVSTLTPHVLAVSIPPVCHVPLPTPAVLGPPLGLAQPPRAQFSPRFKFALMGDTTSKLFQLGNPAGRQSTEQAPHCSVTAGNTLCAPTPEKEKCGEKSHQMVSLKRRSPALLQNSRQDKEGQQRIPPPE